MTDSSKKKQTVVAQTKGKPVKKQVKKPAVKRQVKKKRVTSPHSENWEELRSDLNAAEVQYLSRIMYRDGYSIMTKAFLLTLLVFAIYVTFDKTTEEKPTDRYFAQKPDGTVTEITPLDKPNLSLAAISNWATNAIPQIYSFDFKNYDSQHKIAGESFFTSSGYTAFRNALSNGSPSVMATVLEKSYVVTTTLKGEKAKVEKHGRFGEFYAWQVSIPVIITYSNSQEERAGERVVRLTIVRTPEIDNPSGIAISKFVFGAS